MIGILPFLGAFINFFRSFLLLLDAVNTSTLLHRNSYARREHTIHFVKLLSFVPYILGRVRLCKYRLNVAPSCAYLGLGYLVQRTHI
jgi:hypothetical protein